MNDVGTGEFVDLCRLVGAEPFLCVNVMTGTPREAAEWVEYCNGGPGRPLGELRRKYGWREPFAVRYWELDNETYRKYDALSYARRCVEYAKAMKAVDPGIKLVMVGYWRFRPFLPQMLEIAGKDIDLVTDRALDESYLTEELKVIREYNRKTGRRIQLCNTEWLAPWQDVPVVPDALNRQPDSSALTLQNRQIRWRYAMNAARQLLLFQRLGGDFLFADFNNLANTWGQNVIECAKEDVYLSATGRVFELLSRSPAAWPLRISASGPTEGITAQAAWDLEKKGIVFTVLNYRSSETEVVFTMKDGEKRFRTAKISVLYAPSPASFNSLRDPNAIKRRDFARTVKKSDRFTLHAPPYSLTHAYLRP